MTDHLPRRKRLWCVLAVDQAGALLYRRTYQSEYAASRRAMALHVDRKQWAMRLGTAEYGVTVTRSGPITEWDEPIPHGSQMWGPPA